MIKKKKLKIAIYSGSIPSTTFIENLINGMSDSHSIFLFGKQRVKPMYSKKSIQCYPTYSRISYNFIITKWRLFLLLVKFPKRFIILWKQLKTKKGYYSKLNWLSRYAPVLLHLPDVFHVQWAKDIEHWMFLKEKLDVKIVLSLRGAHINYSPIVNPKLADSYKMNFNKIDAFHAVSKAIGIEAMKYGAQENRITVINSILSEGIFDKFGNVQPIKSESLSILSVGRHHWKKGYATALDACAILKNKNIPFRYAIIADGPVPEELIYQRDRLNLKEDVIFESKMDQEKVFTYMQTSDLLLLPSLEEGIANVVLEAMGIGLPVISTDCGGMSEVIVHNETGFLVPILDEHKLANQIIEFNELDDENISAIILKAHQFLREEFDSSKSIKKVCELYGSLYK